MSKRRPWHPVICPYCEREAILADSAEVYHGRSYGMIWICRPCGAYVGTHKNSSRHRPLGRLANEELRKWKIRAHRAFDPLWKQRMRRARDRGDSVRQVAIRGEAYKWLADKLGIQVDECHVGMFDVDVCKQVVDACNLCGQDFVDGGYKP